MQSENLSVVSRIVLPKSAQGSVHIVTSRKLVGQTSKGNMSRLELTIKDINYYMKKMKKNNNSPFVADFGCNRQIWLSFNDCDDICDPK